jgi:hypothetical protein
MPACDERFGSNELAERLSESAERVLSGRIHQIRIQGDCPEASQGVGMLAGCRTQKPRILNSLKRALESQISMSHLVPLLEFNQRKENAPEFDYSSFYAKTGAGDTLLCGGGLAFLMTCLRTAAHEEISPLSVLKFPIFRVPEYSELLIRTDSRSRWNQERGVAELGIFLAANLAPAVDAYCSSAKF